MNGLEGSSLREQTGASLEQCHEIISQLQHPAEDSRCANCQIRCNFFSYSAREYFANRRNKITTE
jgi:hypothetical protein